MNPPVIVLAGATASGKSAVALELAARLNGEIVSVDSMQVYRGMDIGTAKPGKAEQDRVPHHMLDVLTLRQECDAAIFGALARKAIAGIQARGKRPILCGGTGFYLKAILEGLAPNPASSPQLRAELEQQPDHILLEELAREDPVTYERIDRRNRRRIIRAVEILRLGGRGLIAKDSPERLPWAGVALSRAAEDLRVRIDLRVEAMFQQGLIGETQSLLAEGLAENRTASQALGYKQVLDHLRGERSLPDTVDRVKIQTRHYAKRQRTWFRKQAQLEWISVGVEEPPADTAGRIAAFFQAAGVLS